MSSIAFNGEIRLDGHDLTDIEIYNLELEIKCEIENMFNNIERSRVEWRDYDKPSPYKLVVKSKVAHIDE